MVVVATETGTVFSTHLSPEQEVIVTTEVGALVSVSTGQTVVKVDSTP